jgi:hypothetical protein
VSKTLEPLKNSFQILAARLPVICVGVLLLMNGEEKAEENQLNKETGRNKLAANLPV